MSTEEKKKKLTPEEQQLVSVLIVSIPQPWRGIIETGAAELRAAHARIAELESSPAPVADEPVEALIDAARQLFSYVSYAEMVGGIGLNRPHIREWCDKTIAAIHEVEKRRAHPATPEGGEG